MSDAIDARPAPVPREQERLAVDDGRTPKAKAKPARKRAAKKKAAS